MSLIRLENIGHAFLGRTVLDAIDLAIEPGEIVALVGPSGSGKSTLAHIAAGIIEPLRGRVIRQPGRHGMVFQEPRLMPWATTGDNIAYPLRILGLSRAERRNRAREAALQVALIESDLELFPSALSGGMKQRTAIARALVANPDFILFDEPFTALDVALKRRMQDIVIDAAQRNRFGGLFITHDLTEAARIAHRIAVLDVGGRGIAGTRIPDGEPGARGAEALFSLTQHYQHEDPLFRHIHDVDERRLS